MRPAPVGLPAVDGILSAEQVAETAASIAAMQEPCGAVPWPDAGFVSIVTRLKSVITESACQG